MTHSWGLVLKPSGCSNPQVGQGLGIGPVVARELLPSTNLTHWREGEHRVATGVAHGPSTGCAPLSNEISCRQPHSLGREPGRSQVGRWSINASSYLGWAPGRSQVKDSLAVQVSRLGSDVVSVWPGGRQMARCYFTGEVARLSLDSNATQIKYCSTLSRARCFVVMSAGLAGPSNLTNSTAFLRLCSCIKRARRLPPIQPTRGAPAARSAVRIVVLDAPWPS